jgi:zinc transport system substrate-binding protein
MTFFRLFLQMTCSQWLSPPRRFMIGPNLRRVAGFAIIALAVAACQRAPADQSQVLVVVSLYPLYDFARHIAGDRARVTLLVPPGVEPHDWEPAPADIMRVQSARVFVYNGAGLEPWAEKLLGEVRRGDMRIVKATAGLDLLTTEGQPDPHVWLDPLLARAEVEAIRTALVAVDPVHAPIYDGNAAAFSSQLLALHERFAAGLERCERREIVVSHAAFAYLARRYRLTQLPIIESLTPDAEPSPAALAALTRQARRARVTHVFFETLVTSKLAETLAREVSATALVLNPVEGLTKEQNAQRMTYIQLMDANLTNLRTALGCR